MALLNGAIAQNEKFSGIVENISGLYEFCCVPRGSGYRYVLSLQASAAVKTRSFYLIQQSFTNSGFPDITIRNGGSAAAFLQCDYGPMRLWGGAFARAQKFLRLPGIGELPAVSHHLETEGRKFRGQVRVSVGLLSGKPCFTY